jgi:hypothetical protein
MNETLFGKYILKINRQNKFIQEIKIFVEFERYECAMLHILMLRWETHPHQW